MIPVIIMPILKYGILTGFSLTLVAYTPVPGMNCSVGLYFAITIPQYRHSVLLFLSGLLHFGQNKTNHTSVHVPKQLINSLLILSGFSHIALVIHYLNLLLKCLYPNLRFVEVILLSGK